MDIIATALLALTVVSSGLAQPSVRTSAGGVVTELSTASSLARRAIHFRLLFPDGDRRPPAATLTVRDVASAAVWNVAIASEVVAKRQTLLLPAGEYDVVFSVPHHAVTRQRADARSADVALGNLALTPNPVISGEIGSTAGPLAGAFVSSGTVAGKSDAIGRFTLEIDGDWPEQLDVTYPGFASKRVSVPKARASVRLPAITLSQGSTLELTLDAAPDSGRMSIDLARPRGLNQSADVFRSLSLEKGTSSARFENIEPGETIVILRGEKPLQRLSRLLRLKESEVRAETIRIDPLQLDVEVRRGTAGVGGAFLTLRNGENHWSADLKADADGNVSAEAWERGDVLFVVRATESGAPLLLPRTLEGTSRATVRLDVPVRRIRGTVLDETGAPIRDALVRIESVNDDGTAGTMSVMANAQGTFVADGLRDAKYTLVAERSGYLPSDRVVFHLDEAVPEKQVDISLFRGDSRRVVVRSVRGLPLIGAFLVVMSDGEAIETARTDANGDATVHTRPGRPAVVYVVPREGSFAARRLASPRESAGEEQITVPEGDAALELQARTTSGEPLPHLHFLMRYNGEIIPPEVEEVLEMQRGVAATTDANGVVRIDRLPQGFWECWPVRNLDELRDVLAGGPVAAPVQVSARYGLNVARMTFAPKIARP